MARLELKNTIVRIRDGLSGSGAIDEDTTAPVVTDAAFDINTLVLNAGGLGTDVVPIGARFTVAGETLTTQVHVVTERTPSDGLATTTNIVFSPALGAGTYVDEGVVTFAPIQIDIKVGDGNVTYTESSEYEYDLDRGVLDTVRAGDEVPMDVSLDFVYEYITTQTGEAVSPMDALKKIGGAAEWRSSSSDACEPYAVDIEVVHTPICTTQAIETTLFPDFRSDSREVDLGEASVAVSGRCNVTQPTMTRTAQ